MKQESYIERFNKNLKIFSNDTQIETDIIIGMNLITTPLFLEEKNGFDVLAQIKEFGNN